MQIIEYISSVTGKTSAELGRLVTLRQDIGATAPHITYWDASLGPQPTPEEIADALTAGPSQAELVAYTNRKQWALATGGYTVTIGGTARTFASDEQSFWLITGKALRMQQTGAPTSLIWQFGPTTFVTLSLADFVEAATQIADFMQATFDAAAPVVSAIQAGTITTYAAVDAAVWPANVSTAG